MGNASLKRSREQADHKEWLKRELQRVESEKLTKVGPALGSNVLIVETIVGFVPFSCIPKLRLVNRTWRDACQKRFALEANLKLKDAEFQLGKSRKISKACNFPTEISFRKFTIWDNPKTFYNYNPIFGSYGTPLLRFLHDVGPRIEFLDCRLSIWKINRLFEIIHKELTNLTHLTLNLDITLCYPEAGYELVELEHKRVLGFLGMEFQKIPLAHQIRELRVEIFWDVESSHYMPLRRIFYKTAEMLLKRCISLEVFIIEDQEFLEAVQEILQEPERSGLISKILIEFPRKAPTHLNLREFDRLSQLGFRRVSVKILDKNVNITLPEADQAKMDVELGVPGRRHGHIALQLELNALAALLEKQRLNLVHLHLYVGNQYQGFQGFQEARMELSTLSTLELPTLRILRLSFCRGEDSSSDNIHHVTRNFKLNWEERFPKLFALLLDTLEEGDLKEIFSNFCAEDEDEEVVKPLKSVKVLGFPAQYPSLDFWDPDIGCKYDFTEVIPFVDVLFPNLIWFVDLKYLGRAVVDPAKVHYWSDIRRRPNLEDCVRSKYSQYPLVEDSRFISEFADCLRATQLDE